MVPSGFVWIQTGQTQNTCTWEALATIQADERLGSSSMEKVLAQSKLIMCQQWALSGKVTSIPGFIKKNFASRWGNWLPPLLRAYYSRHGLMPFLLGPHNTRSTPRTWTQEPPRCSRSQSTCPVSKGRGSWADSARRKDGFVQTFKCLYLQGGQQAVRLTTGVPVTGQEAVRPCSN